ncbi:hypothetical protein PJP10_13810 [Mycobacterium kansasii]
MVLSRLPGLPRSASTHDSVASDQVASDQEAPLCRTRRSVIAERSQSLPSAVQYLAPLGLDAIGRANSQLLRPVRSRPGSRRPGTGPSYPVV